MLPEVSLDSNCVNGMTAKSITTDEQRCEVSHVRRLILPIPPPSSLRLLDATYTQLLAASSEHTVCQQTAHDSRQCKEVGLAQRYRLSILLPPLTVPCVPARGSPDSPLFQIDEPCKYSADQSCSSVYNTSGASQLFGVSFSPSEKIVDTASGARPIRPMRAPLSLDAVCVIRILLCSD